MVQAIVGGNEYEWDKICKEYPDMYAIITDEQRKDGTIVRCRVWEIVPYNKRGETTSKYRNKGFTKFSCERTTFNAPNVGVIL